MTFLRILITFAILVPTYRYNSREGIDRVEGHRKPSKGRLASQCKGHHFNESGTIERKQCLYSDAASTRLLNYSYPFMAVKIYS